MPIQSFFSALCNMLPVKECSLFRPLTLFVVLMILNTCAAKVEQSADQNGPIGSDESSLTERSTNIGTLTNLGENRKGRKFLGKIGFLAGLHIGSGISSSGSLAASHSVKVFGKVMNTALSVSYGPAGPQGVGGPGPILHDPPPPAEDSVTGKPVSLDPSKGQEPALNKMSLISTNESAIEEKPVENEIRQEAKEDNEIVGEEIEPPSTTKRTLFQYLSRRQASIEQKPEASSTGIDRQRIEFLKDHHRHIATFNQHFHKLSGDVSKVVRIAGR